MAASQEGRVSDLKQTTVKRTYLESIQTFDILLANGWIIDGTGAARRRGDVGIVGDRIAAIGELRAQGASAKQTIDAAGKVIAPGFIDTHGHDDLMFVERPDLEWKTSQGVTTVIVGNCGVSAAPRPLIGNTAAALALLGQTELFDSYHAYFQQLERLDPMINVASLVGHANLRLAAMKNPLARPTSDELARMRQLLEEALEAGVAGMSTGLAYEPGCMAEREELLALASVAARQGALHTSHIRNEGDEVVAAVDEVLELGAASGCATIISHHKCLMPRNWGGSETTLRNVDRARESGQAVAMDVYPYNASSTILIADRAELIDDIKITWSTPHPECGGRYLADIAAEWGCGRKEAAERLSPAGAIYFAMDEADVQRVLAHPCCMVGSDGLPNDANPHPRLWGSFTRVLGNYVRRCRLLSLEEAISKMTALPASVFGLADRGTLRAGAFADVVIFDPDIVEDRADWDHPTLRSVGIEHVFINGTSVFPEPPSRRPGRVLKRHQQRRAT
ncbi:D-aminoacylase [Alcaligenaceae bacterium]|nr:D-aminoacylase [Alcaligenaceae bacterium]